jgi:hypothetical protein
VWNSQLRPTTAPDVVFLMENSVKLDDRLNFKVCWVVDPREIPRQNERYIVTYYT